MLLFFLLLFNSWGYSWEIWLECHRHLHILVQKYASCKKCENFDIFTKFSFLMGKSTHLYGLHFSWVYQKGFIFVSIKNVHFFQFSVRYILDVFRYAVYKCSNLLFLSFDYHPDFTIMTFCILTFLMLYMFTCFLWQLVFCNQAFNY